MLQLGSWLLQCARTFIQRSFLLFGHHCATHQTRVILISCIIITSLFYPALALYSSSSTKSVSIIDAFISPDSVSGLQQDLDNIWTGHGSLRVRDDAVSRARCGVGRVVRVERILIQSPLAEEDSALNQQILLSTLDFENRLDALLSSREITCLKGTNGQCLVISPLAFWGYDRANLLSDLNILDKLSTSKNASVSGIPVTPQMVLAGRGSNEHMGGTHFDFANYIALTYFFPESDCFGNLDRLPWQQAVETAAQNAQLDFHVNEPTLIALEHDPRLSTRKGWSAMSAFLYLAYFSFFAYVSWSMRQMNAVHSRIGLTFTALVEIAVSTITSLSVCALVGFKVTLVPWELLPLIIVFVGAENMFNLVDAVTKTSITLSVKQRIAEGLSRAGTSNTLKVVSYNAILGIIAVFAHGAIRQFCAFAVVVLVAHWFLAHTFFIAVLSIDIQRLELEELLRQDSSLVPAVHQESTPASKSQNKFDAIALGVRRLLKGRATKNLSLLLLLAITATLYYTTLPSSKADVPIPIRGALSRNGGATNGSRPDPAWQVWKTLNPNEATLHLRMELPTILTLGTSVGDDGVVDHKHHRSRFSMRTLRFMFWLLKIMVLPIAITTSALWRLLVYLLKDTELLEAQRNKAEPDQTIRLDDHTELEHEVSFSTLPRTFDSDVEFLATSKDGQIVISVGLQNEIVIWRLKEGKHTSIDATDVLLRAASSSSASSALTCVAVDDEGRFCAAGTGAGVIALWSIQDDDIHPLPHLVVDNSSAGVLDIHFSSIQPPIRTPPSSAPTTPTTHPFLLATYENGSAAKWSLEELSSPTIIMPNRQADVVKTTIVRVCGDGRLVVAFCMENGTLALVEADEGRPSLTSDLVIHAGNPMDTVSQVDACRVIIDDDPRVVIVAATHAGAISLWDGQTGEFIHMLEEAYGKVAQLCLSPVQCDTCRYCGQKPLDSFAIVFSVDNVVRFFKAYLSDDSRRCACNSNATRPRRVPSWDNLSTRRSRSNSIVSAPGTSSPLMPRSRAPSEASPFPVSGHGVHSRRASEKENRTTAMSIFPSNDDYDYDHPIGPPETFKASRSGTSSIWHRTLVTRAADTTCERGGWNVVNGRVVGIRRRTRTPVHSKGKVAANTLTLSTQGLSAATLDRWEFWTYDPAVTLLQSSALSMLSTVIEEVPEDLPEPSSPLIPRLPFTRVSPFIISRSRSLAGFGNTLGVFNFLSS